MKVAVWDTYVPRKDGRIMHFDILVPSHLEDEEAIFTFGKAYIATKGEAGQPLAAQQCRFCHVEHASEALAARIATSGYHIIEMENCT